MRRHEQRSAKVVVSPVPLLSTSPPSSPAVHRTVLLPLSAAAQPTLESPFPAILDATLVPASPAAPASPAVPSPSPAAPPTSPPRPPTSPALPPRPKGRPRSHGPRVFCPPPSRHWPPTGKRPSLWAPPRSRRWPPDLCRSPWQRSRCPLPPLHRPFRRYPQRAAGSSGHPTACSPPKSWRPTCGLSPSRSGVRRGGVSFLLSGPAGSLSFSFGRSSIF